jgi:chromosome partitioning protein
MAVIAVFNQTDGVGKTTTALNVLAAIARRGLRPLGIDLDWQARLSQAFGARPELADDSVRGFFVGGRSLADIAQITRSGVAICPAHAELATLDSFLGRGLAAVTRLRRELRRPGLAPGPVVVDCGAPLDVLVLNALFACDLLLVPLTCDYKALHGAREVERALNALEPVWKRRLPRRYLLTRVDSRQATSGVIVAQMEESLRRDEICATRIRESAALAESPALRLDVFRHAPDSSGAQDYRALVDELLGAGLVG